MLVASSRTNPPMSTDSSARPNHSGKPINDERVSATCSTIHAPIP